MELVAGAGQTFQRQAIEAVMGFQMGKAHFDLAPLIRMDRENQLSRNRIDFV